MFPSCTQTLLEQRGSELFTPCAAEMCLKGKQPDWSLSLNLLFFCLGLLVKKKKSTENKEHIL